MPEQAVRDEQGRLMLARKGIGLSCLTRVFDVDLDATPVIEIVTAPGNAHWRLTAVAADPTAPDDDTLLADHQTEGACRRNVRERLALSGRRKIRVRLIMWGWGGSDPQCLTVTRAAFAPSCEESDARGMSGLMLERHRSVLRRAAEMHPVSLEHPRLRYRAAEKRRLQRRARRSHRAFAAAVLQRVRDLEREKAQPDVLLSPELIRGDNHKWRPYMLQLAPPQPPPLRPGRGWTPFELEGARVETTWRVMYWHLTSNWVIGSALTDDPVFGEQARRWALAVSRWKFWLRPNYEYFDFNTSYPLQSLCHWYDIAHGLMSDREREEVRDAIAQLARGLYLNAITGHGAIYNDLRGNHTAVSFCGLGTAGLALLGEHPEAAHWAALAERFMLDAFEEHTSGAWTESPSYGNYGVNEWLRLAELLRNVAGRDHLRHPFLKRYADFQLMICDWEGRNLGYNGGGAGSRWNHWIFFYIAREWDYPEAQWLANFALHDSPESYPGYGDAFWWVDTRQKARRPKPVNTGRTFEDVGVNVWRSGWEDAPTMLLHHCGRKGQHKEANMNHFTLYALGQRLLPDGIGHGVRDHNVPVVGGRNQNKWGPGATVMYHCDRLCGYSRGDATRSYRCKALRHVLFLREGVLVVIDDIDVGARAEQSVEFLLNPNGETSSAHDVFRIAAGDVMLLGLVADHKGNRLPVTVRERKTKRRATHRVAATRTGRGPTRTITFLRFGRERDLADCSLAVTPGEERLDFNCGAQHWRLGLRAGQIAPGVSTNAGLWLCRIDDGEPVLAMAVAESAGATASVVTPNGPVRGTGCVSWSASPPRQGVLRSLLPFLR